MKRNYLKKFIVAVVVAAIVVALPEYNAIAKTAADVSNKGEYSTDVIYQIVTDRFYDGDTSNNPSGDIFDKSDMKKYHGGDWEGIIDKINDGYLINMGISALWISSPVENITTVDPSNNCASYHGYWAKDFFKTNTAFGDIDDFADLVTTAHNHGIKVI